jgi:hypothetical protein
MYARAYLQAHIGCLEHDAGGLQVRVHVLNDELGAAFQRSYAKLGSGPEAQLAA